MGKRQMAGEKQIEKETVADCMALESMLSKIPIPPIPANRLQLLSILRQPNDKIDIDALTRLVSVDPGLFSMVLKLANSSYYRGLEKIISLRGAITRIGLTDTVNSISFYCVQNTLPPFPTIKEFSSEAYWTFSWACAMAARRLGHPNLGMNVLPGELYMAGLLHGIGKLMMAIHYPEDFEKCVIKAEKTKQPLHKTEQEIFGTVNGFLASKIMKSWNLPDNICEGVAFYQIPELAPPEYREIAGLIQFAYKITASIGIGANGDCYGMDISATYIGRQTHLALSRESVQMELVKELKETVEQKYQSVSGTPSQDATNASDTNANHQAYPEIHPPAAPPHPDPSRMKPFSRLWSFFRNLAFKFSH